jgi:hypothetical protein
VLGDDALQKMMRGLNASYQAAMFGLRTTAFSWSKTKVSFDEHSPHNQKWET